uniref:Uncharacterized protein n=1 Tax=Anguilla anguilla TaxID=7936 RepID=A0A0E9RRP1_ANGAN
MQTCMGGFGESKCTHNQHSARLFCVHMFLCRGTNRTVATNPVPGDLPSPGFSF